MTQDIYGMNPTLISLGWLLKTMQTHGEQDIGHFPAFLADRFHTLTDDLERFIADCKEFQSEKPAA